MSDDLMHQVNEDLRRQQMEDFWRENRLWILGGIVLAILATAGMAGWRHHEHNQNLAATGALIEATASNDAEELRLFAMSTDDSHAALARFTAANLYLEKGETAKALEVFDAIRQSKADRIWRDLAAVYSIQQRLTSAEPQDLHKELKPLLDDKNPWRFTAMELEALLLAREGKMTEAAERLSLISGDAQAPQDARTRAFTLRELYAANAGSTAQIAE